MTMPRTAIAAFLFIAASLGTGQTAGEASGATLIVDGEYGQLFGAAEGDSWLSAEDALALAEKGRTFSLYTESGLHGRCTIEPGWKWSETCAQPRLDARGCAAFGESTLAIAASWNAAPRLAEPLDPRQPVYRELLSTWLSKQGIDDKSPTVTQLLRVDLEGDGVAEILISATRRRGDVRSALPGDYSVILLRRLVRDTVRTSPLLQDLYRDACEMECEPRVMRVVALLDVNGDGILEIITEANSFEGVKRTVFSTDNEGAQARLSWSCGV